jgi:signal transduction histidine kinase
MFQKSGRSRLLQQIVFISFAVGFSISVLLSLVHTYQSYTEGQVQIISRVDFLSQALQPQLESQLWSVDQDSVRRTLTALSNDENVAQVEILNSEFQVPPISTGLVADWIVKTYPLYFNEGGVSHKLGTLSISLTKKRFLNHFWSDVVWAVIQNLIKFFVTAVVLIAIFNHKVTAPIYEIQRMTRKFSEEQLSSILGFKWEMQPDSQKTELEALQSDIHQLQINFQNAFQKQKETEQAKLSAELQLEKERQKMKLTQRLDSIGQITSQVVHDFGNIVMIINGKIFMLEKQLQSDTQRKLTSDIQKAVARAQGLTAKLLRMTRYQETEQTVFDPFQSLHDLRDLLKTAVGSSIDVELRAETTGQHIQANPGSFENAVINLCVNARDAMPNGGQISIEIKAHQKESTSYVAISVIDTGTGIPTELQEKIFEPFFTTKAMGKGTGLGLAQVQEFVKETGGWMGLTSSNQGTIFTMYIPEKMLEGNFQAA